MAALQRGASLIIHYQLSIMHCLKGGGSRPVSRVLYRAGKPTRDNHSSGMCVAAHLKQPTREQCGQHIMFPYLVLLRVGFTLPCLLPDTRCALTAPFHPYQPRLAVYFLWHLPWARAPQALPGTLSCGARTFLPALVYRAIAWPTPASNITGSAR
jgi:hypothetical protein